MSRPTQEELFKLIEEIRTTLRDDPAFNRLLDEDHPFESSPKQIATAIKQVVNHINCRPPVLSRKFSWYDFPDRYLLVLGVCALLQRGVSDVDDRNYLPAMDGQVNMNNRAKAAAVRSSAMAKWNEFLQGVDMLKMSLNLQSAMGGLGLASQTGSLLLADRLLDNVIFGDWGVGR